MKILAIGFVLFLAISPCYSQSKSGSIKICNVEKDTDASWLATIDSLALFISKNHMKAPEIYEQKGQETCEFVGNVDRSKMRSDFILVVKKHNKTIFDCDPEWGRSSFGILNFFPESYKSVKTTYANMPYVAKLAFTSSEKEEKLKWYNVTSSKNLMGILVKEKKLLSPQSRIPDEYPFKAAKEERMKRRTLKAVIALMSLAVCSLLVIMFLGSLARYNESKKIKAEELERKKRHEQKEAAEPEPTSKKLSSEKSEKTTKKSEKTEKSKKDSEKQPLIDLSKKSQKSDKSSAKSAKKRD
uniref:Lipoprotein n=1 Tax=Caenorhabditis tropicalis TaxID=1561998 RepID=A0A1I7TQ47_9PELO